MEDKKTIIPQVVKESVEYRVDQVLRSDDIDEIKTERLDNLFLERYPFLDEIAIRCLTNTLLTHHSNGLQSSYD
tara:strand:- start:1428 stop:1649 length:222 start_codon:yes stop_codon:yes gene_type:complete